jgi:hypothetical protein
MKLMRIRAARVAELPSLQAIERAAGLMFCDIGMPEIAEYDRGRCRSWRPAVTLADFGWWSMTAMSLSAI